jgi:hypothetical protein
MIKIVALLRRKAGTAHDAFRDYYESRHVPLATSVMADLIVDYRRNYVQTSMGYFGGGADDAAADYDCVTEVVLPDKSAVDALFARMADPVVSAPIIADEERFLDRGAIRMMICEIEPS